MNTNFKVVGLTRLGIKPKSTAPDVDALSVINLGLKKKRSGKVSGGNQIRKLSIELNFHYSCPPPRLELRFYFLICDYGSVAIKVATSKVKKLALIKKMTPLLQNAKKSRIKIRRPSGTLSNDRELASHSCYNKQINDMNSQNVVNLLQVNNVNLAISTMK